MSYPPCILARIKFTLISRSSHASVKNFPDNTVLRIIGQVLRFLPFYNAIIIPNLTIN